jgi:hypothetical protein
MVAAALTFVQGLTVGIAGQALYGALAAAVVVSNGNNTGVAVWTYTVIDVPPGSVVPTGVVQTGLTPTWTFFPDVTGGYLVEVTVTDAFGNTVSDIRCFGVKEAHGLFQPPFAANAAMLNFSNGKRGWAVIMEAWFTYILTIGGGGGGGIIPPTAVNNAGMTSVVLAALVASNTNAGARLAVDCSAGSVAIGMPALPAGTPVIITIVKGDPSVHAVTLTGPGGQTIQHQNGPMTATYTTAPPTLQDTTLSAGTSAVTNIWVFDAPGYLGTTSVYSASNAAGSYTVN